MSRNAAGLIFGFLWRSILLREQLRFQIGKHQVQSGDAAFCRVPYGGMLQIDDVAVLTALSVFS